MLYSAWWSILPMHNSWTGVVFTKHDALCSPNSPLLILACTSVLTLSVNRTGFQNARGFWRLCFCQILMLKFVARTRERPYLYRCHWTVKQCNTTPESAKSSWSSFALKFRSQLAFLAIPWAPSCSSYFSSLYDEWRKWLPENTLLSCHQCCATAYRSP